MISYAQNQEDVVLHRLLELVQIGSYVDVGAGHPVLDNVTYDLYQSGWRGVNIEPMEREADLLRSVRPEDQTLQCAVGAQPGTLTLLEAPLSNRGATTARRDLAERYLAEAGEAFVPFDVEVRTLSSVVDAHLDGHLHILKIDVEGMEAEVLAGADLDRIRPWVLVIEATVPNSRVISVDWEALVLDSGYRMTLFDGLNRFYVRNDLDHVADLLSSPANVFDQWVRYETQQLHESLAEVNAYVRALSEELGKREEYVASLRDELERTRNRALTAEAHAEALERQLGRR
jgi:FkbM family methyltransferase